MVKLLSILFLIIFTFISLAFAGMVETIHFNTPALLAKSAGYDVVKIPGTDFTAEPGNPQLPVITKHYLIPKNAVVTDIEIINKKEEYIEGNFNIYPVQEPAILKSPIFDFKPAPWVGQNPLVYNSTKPYPVKCVKIGASGNLSGYKIVSINFYPYKYIPRERKLIKIKEVTFTINYRTVRNSTKVKRISKEARYTLSKLITAICANPEEVYDPFKRTDSDSTVDYVIITSPSFASYFQPLRDWKTEKGINTRIVTTDSIYTNYSGADNQEKIRNFIKDAHTNWGTIWVLLGGDTGIVPARIAFAMACEAGYQPQDEDSIRADLYYSDLDGDWNYNGTPPYGEVADSVDLYPDVFVGRAPASSTSEVTTFVNKILTYEISPPLDYELNALFFAMILWSDPYTDSGVGKNIIDSLYVPSRFNITKLYESLGNENWNTVTSAINSGQNLLNHDGHAWYTVMGIGSDYLTRSDMDNLTNGLRQGILYSIGCWSTAIDYDAIAEHYVNNPNGGGVAFIGNCRYGWGSPGNPGFGYSDRFDATFYDILLTKGLQKIGYTLAMDKVYYIPRSRQANVYRWHQYQLNLLGDPEMSIWTDTPEFLSVSYPDTIQDGMNVNIVVRDEHGNPVKNALVCLLKGSEIYERGYTNQLGEFMTTISVTSPGMVKLTATADNFIPFRDSLYAQTQGPYLAYYDHSIQDNITGNNDGLLNPGESAYLFVNMKNYGTQPLTDPTIKITTPDTFVSIIDSLHTYTGTVSPNTTVLCTFALSVSSNAENNDVAKLDLNASSTEGNWESWGNQIISKPILSVRYDSLYDENNNGIPEPGENVDLYYSLMNYGYGYGYITSLQPRVLHSLARSWSLSAI
ncbi:MAG: hypothetical protein B5M53_01285 [Candidatus Cloacimonas sp. 4484_209]|nr:MAG: hypothetical protein B5M53_01285 [Candidatus Cloacimonas sp. 4484_209]